MSVKLLKQSAVSNPNLLINGDFQVWQRGESFNYNISNKYSADRWILSHGAYYNAMKIARHIKGMQITLTSSSGSGGSISQYIEGSKADIPYTLSVSINDNIYVLTGTPNSAGTEISKSFTDFKISIKWDTLTKCMRVSIWFSTINKAYIVNWVKLEYGVLNTMFTSDLYTDVLMQCKRYYQVFSTDELRIHNYFNDGNSKYFNFNYVIPMRISPTIGGTWDLWGDDGGLLKSSSSMIRDYIGVYNMRLGETIQSPSGGIYIQPHDLLQLDAEIYPS